MPGHKCVQVGELAPDFVLPAASGEEVRLSSFLGRDVVLFFYPKDDTPGCTAEACAFRENHEAFQRAGVQVLGISSDPPESHRRFAERLCLPFPLLSDAGGEVRKRFGVARTLGLIPGRVSFLIDRAGIVRHVFASPFQPTRHVAEALAALERWRAEAP